MRNGYFTAYDIHQAYRRAFSHGRPWRRLTLRAKYTFAMIAIELNDVLEKERKP